MTLGIYSIRDIKGNVYNIPFFTRNEGEAERAVIRLLMNPQSTVCQFPDDYDLYALGLMDDVSGQISLNDSPTHVLKVSSLVPAAKKYLQAMSDRNPTPSKEHIEDYIKKEVLKKEAQKGDTAPDAFNA